MNSAEKTHLESEIIRALEACYDPEIPVNIYDLGLVYAIEIGDAADVHIKMTLTTQIAQWRCRCPPRCSPK